MSYNLLAAWTTTLQVDFCNLVVWWRFRPRRVLQFWPYCCRGEQRAGSDQQRPMKLVPLQCAESIVEKWVGTYHSTMLQPHRRPGRTTTTTTTTTTPHSGFRKARLTNKKRGREATSWAMTVALPFGSRPGWPITDEGGNIGSPGSFSFLGTNRF